MNRFAAPTLVRLPRAGWLALLFGAFAGPARSEPTFSPPVDLSAFEREASRLFAPQTLLGPDSPLVGECDATRTLLQALAALLIMAGLLLKMRRDTVQMESIASMMLRVAFIATVPFWQALALQTADAIGAAVTTESHTAESVVLSRSWQLLAQWAPPGSPALDALAAQDHTPPTSGEEEAWALQAWNWARGVGVASENLYAGCWQALSGSLRGAIVFVGCAALTAVTAVSLFLAQFAALARVVMFEAGCALAPLFIAALGVESLRNAALRWLLGLGAIALWPVGWAFADILTIRAIEALVDWMQRVAAAALQLPTAAAAPPLSVAAPYLGWGVLAVFGAASLVVCLWFAASVVFVPVLFQRAVAASAASFGARSY